MNSQAKSQPRRDAKARAAHATQALQAAIETYIREMHPDAGEWAIVSIRTGKGTPGNETIPMRFPKPTEAVRPTRRAKPAPAAA